MKDYNTEFEIDGKKYKAIFNLNVVQEIQNKYETIDRWGELTEGKVTGEANVEALIFGFKSMLNEAIDIENETLQEAKPLFTEKQVGRLITKWGIQKAQNQLQNTVIEGTKSESSKNE